MKKTTLLLSAAVLAATLLPQNVNADPPVAPITWEPAKNITGDSDVSTLGTLLYAYNIGAAGVASTTVNGVHFSSFAFPPDQSNQTVTVGDLTFTENPGLLISSNLLSSVSGNFSSLSSDYQTLLGTGGSADQGGTIGATLGGLTVGQNYLIQWWSNDSALLYGGFFAQTEASQDGNPSTVTLDSNLPNSMGGLGQYAIGTFTATDSFVNFNLNGIGGLPLINAFQIRDVTSAAVPEPGQVAASLLLLAGIGGYVWLKRRKPAKSEAPAA
jgi:hypothetical protein